MTTLPAQLRALADEMEASGETRSICGVRVMTNGEILTFGWGDTSMTDAIAVLEAGAASLRQETQ